MTESRFANRDEKKGKITFIFIIDINMMSVSSTGDHDGLY